jgi:hypothetical protein
MHVIRLGLIFCISFLLAVKGVSQEKPDSLKPKHSPKLATAMSAVLPGLGQAYNKKYWKIPVIYVASGTLIYMSLHNNTYYQRFKKAYKELYNTDPTGYYYMYNTSFTLSGLEAEKNHFRKNRDFYTILTVGVYVMNIIDATVDAYLFNFDISDNLSMRMSPDILMLTQNNTATPGVKICFSFEK